MLQLPAIPRLPARVLLALLAGALPASAFGSDEREASANLLRPDPAAPDSINGSVEIQSDFQSGSEQFTIEIDDADLPDPHDLYLETAVGSGVLNLILTLPASGNGFKLELDTANGDTLPGGAVDTDALVGLDLEIRANGTVVLSGTVPEYLAFEAELKGEAPLRRPASATDSDAKGEIEVRSEPHKGRDRFEVKVEHVDAALTHELYLEDAVGSGTMTLVGTFDVDGSEDGDDELEYELDTDDGAGLPLGATSMDQLTGRRVEVRAAGAVVLEGTVPDFLALKKKLSIETQLVRPDPAPDANAKGELKLSSEPFKGRERLKLEVERVDTATAHDFYLEDAVGSGNMTFVGTLAPDGSDEMKFVLDTQDGDALPLLAAINADLAGLRIEVQAGGQVVLFGIVPSVGAPRKAELGQVFIVRPDAGPNPDATGALKMKTESHKGRNRFEIKLKKADPAVAHELYIEDNAGSGTLVLAGTFSGSGKQLRFRIDTKKGEGMPLAASANTDLGGRLLEVRVAGVAVLQGRIPDVVTRKQAAKGSKQQLKLAAAGASPNALVVGRLKLSSRPAKGDERFELEAAKLEFSGTAYHVFVEDGVGSGIFQDVGLLVQKSSSSKGRFRRRTRNGQGLPFGVTSVGSLAARLFELRDDLGSVYLEGTIPAMN